MKKQYSMFVLVIKTKNTQCSPSFSSRSAEYKSLWAGKKLPTTISLVLIFIPNIKKKKVQIRSLCMPMILLWFRLVTIVSNLNLAILLRVKVETKCTNCLTTVLQKLHLFKPSKKTALLIRQAVAVVLQCGAYLDIYFVRSTIIS